MNITNLFDLSYWFAIYTPPLRRSSFIVAVIVLAGLFIAGIVLKTIAKNKKNNPPFSKGLKKVAKPLFLFSILGLFLVWIRQLGAGVISSRFLMLLVFGIALIWCILLVRGFLQTHEEEYRKFQEEKKYKEYLPKKKK